MVTVPTHAALTDAIRRVEAGDGSVHWTLRPTRGLEPVGSHCALPDPMNGKRENAQRTRTPAHNDSIFGATIGKAATGSTRGARPRLRGIQLDCDSMAQYFRKTDVHREATSITVVQWSEQK